MFFLFVNYKNNAEQVVSLYLLVVSLRKTIEDAEDIIKRVKIE